MAREPRKSIRKSFAIPLFVMLFSGCGEFETEPRPNQLPVAHAGNNTVYAFGDSIWLDASRSSDPEDSSLVYVWTTPSGLDLPQEIIDTSPRVLIPSLPKGNHAFTLRVHDGTLESRPDQVLVSIIGPDQFVTKDPRYKGRILVHATITEALARAKFGDTILIDSGEYNENLVISKENLTIMGMPKKSIILDGRKIGSSPIMRFERINGVTVKGLEIRGAASDSDGAIRIVASSAIRFENCVIQRNDAFGIRVDRSSKVSLDSVSILKNKGGGIFSVASQLAIASGRFMGNSPFVKGDSLYGVISFFGTESLSIKNSHFEKDTSIQEIDTLAQVYLWNNSKTYAEGNVFDNVGTAFLMGDGSGSALTSVKNKYRSLHKFSFRCKGNSEGVLESEHDSSSGGISTSIWCNGAKYVSIRNNSIINVTGNQDKNVKGIDLGGCKTGKVEDNQITGFNIAIILNNSPVSIKRNKFLEDSICVCNQWDTSVVMDSLLTNVYSGGKLLDTNCLNE